MDIFIFSVDLNNIIFNQDNKGPHKSDVSLDSDLMEFWRFCDCVTRKSQFWLFHARPVSLAAFVIIITHKGLPQRPVPLLDC